MNNCLEIFIEGMKRIVFCLIIVCFYWAIKRSIATRFGIARHYPRHLVDNRFCFVLLAYMNFVNFILELCLKWLSIGKKSFITGKSQTYKITHLSICLSNVDSLSLDCLKQVEFRALVCLCISIIHLGINIFYNYSTPCEWHFYSLTIRFGISPLETSGLIIIAS